MDEFTRIMICPVECSRGASVRGQNDVAHGCSPDEEPAGNGMNTRLESGGAQWD
jgi:hypothetical protein